MRMSALSIALLFLLGWFLFGREWVEDLFNKGSDG